MRLLVLGGTHFLGRHVATAALERGHDVATFTRGVSGEPPEGARALHGDRDDPEALPKALDGWAPELVVDTSCQTRAAARNAAAVLADVRGYAFVSSLNAYRNWPPGPIGPEDDEPTWTTDDDEYGPIKADAERILGAAVGDRLPHRAGRPDHRPVRPDLPAGLVAGPHRPRRPRRRPRGPGPADRRWSTPATSPAGWWRWPSAAGPAAVNATGPTGMTTLGGLLDVCREVTGSDAEWVPVPEEELLGGRRPAVGAPAAVAARRRSPARPGTSTPPAPASWGCPAGRCGSRSPTPGPGSGRSERPDVPPGRELPGLPRDGGPAARGPVRDLRPTVSRGRSRRPPTCW